MHSLIFGFFPVLIIFNSQYKKDKSSRYGKPFISGKQKMNDAKMKTISLITYNYL